ncbi:MAG: Hsp20/alpha crystallin family protein [Chloroflexi bacterium]|nr:Hsp20/alpha crystallin family protein [Chloroflexota bacterium]
MFPKDWLTTMDAWHREMERLLDDYSKRKPPSGQFSPLYWEPSIDVYESDDSFTILVELCGVHKDDIELTVEGDNLLIKGLRRRQTQIEGAHCQRLEIYWGDFERLVPLSCPVDPDSARATAEDGILEIVLDKANREAKKQVRVLRRRQKRPSAV